MPQGADAPWWAALGRTVLLVLDAFCVIFCSYLSASRCVCGLWQQFAGKLPRRFVGSQDLCDGIGRAYGRGCQDPLDGFGDAQKGKVAAQEGLDSDFVRGVESDTVSAADAGRFVGQAKAREAGEVRLLEVEMRQSCEIEGEVGRHSLRVGHGVEDRQAHVRDGELSEDGAVDIFDQRVDGGLRVDGNANAVGGQVKQAGMPR